MTEAAQRSPHRVQTVVALVLTMACVGLTIGTLLPLISKGMALQGRNEAEIGLTGIAAGLGTLTMSPLVPMITRRIGAVAAMAGGILLAACVIALFPLAPGYETWLMLRFLTALLIALPWVLAETWMGWLATGKDRGRLFAAYAMVWGGGIALGPQILQITGFTGGAPFYTAAGILTLAALPILSAGKTAPNLTATRHKPAAGLVALRRAPTATLAGIIGGMAEMGTFTLFIIYAGQHGIGDRTATSMLSVIGVGGVAMQLLFGWLADRFSTRRALILNTALAVVMIALVEPLLARNESPPPAIWPVLFLLGGTLIGFYSLGLVLIGERFPKDELSAANGAFIGAYTVGALTGPVVLGLAMKAGPAGLPISLGAAFTLLLLVGVTRELTLGRSRRRPSMEEDEPLAVGPPLG